MIFKSLASEYILKSISGARKEYETEWQTIREMEKDFYFGRQLADEYLAGKSNEYGFKHPETKQWVIPKMICNITEKVINKISLVYKKMPRRYFEKKETKENDYNKIFSKNYIMNIGFKEAERMKNLLHRVILRPIYNADNNTWIPYIETEYEPHFTLSNTLYPYAYSIPIKRNPLDKRVKDKEQWYMYWSPEEFYYYNLDGNKKTILDDEQDDWGGKNKYELIPFIEMYNSLPIDEYRSNGALDLIEANRSININLMNINMMIHYQGHNIFVGQGISADEKIDVSTGANKLLCTGSSEKTITLLSPNPKITECFLAIRNQFKFIAETYNLNIEASLETTAPASGFSLIVKNIDLLEAREDDIDMAILQEKELYRVIARMTQVHKIKPRVKEDQELMIDFQEPNFPVNKTEDIQIWKDMIDSNVKNYVEWVMAENPGMTEEEALEKYEYNKKINGNFSRRDLFAEEVKSLEEEETEEEETEEIIE